MPERKAVRAWAPVKAKWPWRDLLTDSERRTVEATDEISRDAKAILRTATSLLNMCRNRAIQRAKYRYAHPSPKEGTVDE